MQRSWSKDLSFLTYLDYVTFVKYVTLHLCNDLLRSWSKEYREKWRHIMEHFLNFTISLLKKKCSHDFKCEIKPYLRLLNHKNGIHINVIFLK